MIDLLIWSKDRACQLELLMRSTEVHFPVINHIHVVFTYSSREYKNAYSELMRQYSISSSYFNHAHIDFYNENFFECGNTFKDATLRVLQDSKADRICVSTDDSVFFRKTEELCEPVIDYDVFSLRLGLNTIVQNPFDGSLQPELKCYTTDYRSASNISDKDDIISWDVNEYNPLSNYGYINGLDGHIYKKDFLMHHLETMEFKNTNQLETGLFHKRPYLRNRMASFRHSVLVNIPHNNMSQYTQSMSDSLAKLNCDFLDGKRISLQDIESKVIVGCHQLIDYVMEE